MYLTGFRNEFFRPFLWGAPAVMIVGGAVALEEGRAFPAPAFLVRLGDASYAIYLCHLMTVALVAHTLGVRPPILFVPVAVVVSIAVGMAFHLALEKPLIAACRCRSPRRPFHPGAGESGLNCVYSRRPRKRFIHTPRRKIHGSRSLGEFCPWPPPLLRSTPAPGLLRSGRNPRSRRLRPHGLRGPRPGPDLESAAGARLRHRP